MKSIVIDLDDIDLRARGISTTVVEERLQVHVDRHLQKIRAEAIEKIDHLVGLAAVRITNELVTGTRKIVLQVPDEEDLNPNPEPK